MEISAISKAELRNTVLLKRKYIPAERKTRWDQQILSRVRALRLDQKEHTPSGTVYCYISIRGEAGTAELIRYFKEKKLRVAVPRVSGREMDFYYIDSFSDLEPGGFGIPEPKSHCEKAQAFAAPVIVPGVAFSKRFERTGYGAGYYDKFFSREPNHGKIGICYDFQLVDAIEVEDYDIFMDRLITPTRSLKRQEEQRAD